ncbi:MAG: hypothetical protein ACRC0V_13025 [Fusobacteriaceae bacterium]
MQTIKKERLIRPAEWAETIGKTRQTVYNWIKKKKIQSKEIEGYIFVVIPIE